MESKTTAIRAVKQDVYIPLRLPQLHGYFATLCRQANYNICGSTEEKKGSARFLSFHKKKGGLYKEMIAKSGCVW